MPLYEVKVIEKMIYDYTKEVVVEADDGDEAITYALETVHEDRSNWNRENEEMLDREYQVKDVEGA